jgi:hypothetical protein
MHEELVSVGTSAAVPTYADTLGRTARFPSIGKRAKLLSAVYDIAPEASSVAMVTPEDRARRAEAVSTA